MFSFCFVLFVLLLAVDRADLLFTDSRLSEDLALFIALSPCFAFVRYSWVLKQNVPAWKRRRKRAFHSTCDLDDPVYQFLFFACGLVCLYLIWARILPNYRISTISLVCMEKERKELMGRVDNALWFVSLHTLTLQNMALFSLFAPLPPPPPVFFCASYISSTSSKNQKTGKHDSMLHDPIHGVFTMSTIDW